MRTKHRLFFARVLGLSVPRPALPVKGQRRGEAVRDAEFGEDAVQVRLDGLLCNAELASDLSVADTFSHAGQDLALAPRQTGRIVAGKRTGGLTLKHVEHLPWEIRIDPDAALVSGADRVSHGIETSR